MAKQGQLWKTYDALLKGDLSRRAFLEKVEPAGVPDPSYAYAAFGRTRGVA